MEKVFIARIKIKFVVKINGNILTERNPAFPELIAIEQRLGR